MGILLWTGNLQIGHVYGLIVALSIALTFQRVAFTSAVPQLVPKRLLGHAIGITETITGFATLFVPLVAVGLLAAIDLNGILILDVSSYAFAIVVTALVACPAAGVAAPGTAAEGDRGRLRVLVGPPQLPRDARLLPDFQPLPGPSPHHDDAAGAVVRHAEPGGHGVDDVGRWRHRGRVDGRIVGRAAPAAHPGDAAGHARPGRLGHPGRRTPALPVIAIGAFGMAAGLSLGNGIYRTLVQMKIPQRYHARAAALNQMISWSTLPFGFAVLAPWSVEILEPLLAYDGALAATVGRFIGVGPGRGIGLLYILIGCAVMILVAVTMRMRVIAGFDRDVPDALPDDLIGAQELAARQGRSA